MKTNIFNDNSTYLSIKEAVRNELKKFCIEDEDILDEMVLNISTAVMAIII